MSQDTDGGGGGTEVAASRGWCGTETKTHHCQPLRHRNRHPPLRETLNHFYCIELSLLPAERTSKRALSLLLALLFPSRRDISLALFLPRLSPGHSRPSFFVLAFLSVTLSFPFCTPLSLPLPFPRLRRPGREIIRTRKLSHPFGCPNGISSLIRGFTAGQTNRPRCRRDNIRKRATSWPNFSFGTVSSSRYSPRTNEGFVNRVKLLGVYLNC